MKNKIMIKAKLAVLALACTAVVSSLQAQISIPSDGSDGALVISNNTVINLANAITGVWTNSNTGTNMGKGVYDPVQWAVVFKYSSVIISNGATLSFLNNPTHAPVVWLVSGNVTINGVLNLDGQNVTQDPVNLPEPGPGGFRGGGGPVYGNGYGFGPGGGGGGGGTVRMLAPTAIRKFCH